MTYEQAFLELAKDQLQGFDEWNETPLFKLWEDGDFPEETMAGGLDPFTESLAALSTLYPPGSDISKLPGWCQIYLLLTEEH